MKIAFIGGGSFHWTTTIVTDLALNKPLHGADLVLHDIDAAALGLLARASDLIVAQADARMRITSTTDRAEALRDASIVILCVAIGGLGAMRQDLAIPERHGSTTPSVTPSGRRGCPEGCGTFPSRSRWRGKWSRCAQMHGS